MAAAPKPTVTRAREELVWELAAKGQTCRQIAAGVEAAGLGRIAYQNVSTMLHRLEDRFLIAQTERIKVVKAKQTASLQLIYGEAMEAWEKSKRPAHEKRTKTTTVTGMGGTEGVVELPGLEVTKTVKGRDGDTNYLAKAMDALDRIRKIWGIDAVPDDPMTLNLVAISPAAAKAALMAANETEGN